MPVSIGCLLFNYQNVASALTPSLHVAHRHGESVDLAVFL